MRFIEAQNRSYDTALREIKAGSKRSHWMWYIFPQLADLGRSRTAKYYAIRDIDEAKAYLVHPVLGARLSEISEALLLHKGTAPERIFGSVDALKLRSSATLFERTSVGDDTVFGELLEGFYAGQRCALTEQLLAR